MYLLLKRFFCLFILSSILFAGCGPRFIKPEFMSPEFNTSVIDKIYVMPALYFKTEPEVPPETDKYIRTGSTWQLEKKGYNCVWVTDKSLVANIQESNLTDKTLTWLGSQSPSEARWLLFFHIKNISINIGLRKTATIELVGYLYDKVNQKLVWRNEVIKKVGSGGLVGIMITDNAWIKDTLIFGSAVILQGLPYMKTEGADLEIRK